jgi:hypothetical protein
MSSSIRFRAQLRSTNLKIYDQTEFTPKSVETAEERLKPVFGVELTFLTPDACSSRACRPTVSFIGTPPERTARMADRDATSVLEARERSLTSWRHQA